MISNTILKLMQSDTALITALGGANRIYNKGVPDDVKSGMSFFSTGTAALSEDETCVFLQQFQFNILNENRTGAVAVYKALIALFDVKCIIQNNPNAQDSNYSVLVTKVSGGAESSIIEDNSRYTIFTLTLDVKFQTKGA